MFFWCLTEFLRDAIIFWYTELLLYKKKIHNYKINLGIKIPFSAVCVL